MSKSLILLGALSIIFLNVSGLAVARADDRAEIQKQLDTEMAGVREHDINKVMSVYAPGPQLVVYDAVPPPKYVGWDAVKADYENYFKAFPGKTEGGCYDVQIGVERDFGYAFEFQKWTFTKADGTQVPLFQRVTQIYRKINGRWLIIHEHASVPADLLPQEDKTKSKN